MKLSIFTDELAVDLTDGITTLSDWGLKWVDLRGRVFGKACERLDNDELSRLAALIKDAGMKVACLESSLAKVHLPDADRQKAEQDKLENIIRAADALDCRLVRGFFYWQPALENSGSLAVQPDQLQKVLDMSAPLIERARKAGLTLAFENCGVTVDEVFAVLNAVGDHGLGLAWDCANEWLAGTKPETEKDWAARLNRSRVVHVKAAACVPGAYDTDIALPWGEVLARLSANGFAGPVSIETHNSLKTITHTDMSKKVLDTIVSAWPGSSPLRPKAAKVAFDPVRFVIVGLGMGMARAKQMLQTEGTKLVGVVDKNPERLAKAASELGVKGTDELEPWLNDPNVDVIFVVTPTGLHQDLCAQASNAGKHVLVTKPMEVSTERCDRMIDAAEKAGKILAVDFEFRLTPGVQRVKQQLDAGALGELRGGNMTLKILRTMDYFKASGGWRGTKQFDGGGVMSNQCIHHIDELVYVLGSPRRVSMRTWTQAHDIEAEDLGCAIWEYENGAVIQITATTNYPHNCWKHELELHGSKGALIKRTGLPFGGEVEQWYLNDKWQTTPPKVDLLPWGNSAQNVADAIRTGADLICSGRDGRRSRAILDAMYQSADRDGAWVEVHSDALAAV